LNLLRIRSLRHRAIAVVCVVVFAPLIHVWLSDLGDATAGARMNQRVERVALKVAESLEKGEDPRRVADEQAARAGVRLRLLDADGAVSIDVDHEAGTGVLHRVGTVFFGPDGAPRLDEWDAQQGPPIERTVVRTAMESGRASACVSTEDRKLLVCEAALRTDDPEISTIYVQVSSRRAIRALYDVRYQLLKLTLFVLVSGLALGWWLGWRMVRPVEMLREQVLARRHARDPAPIALDRDDEFGDLAAAFNELMSALAQRNRANEAFAADLVHELKNPVAAVQAAAEALESGRPVSPERAQRLARVLRDSSHRLDVLASAFLELARAEAGLRSSVREPVDLVLLARGLIAARGAEPVTFELIAPDAAIISGVAERVETALRNLLANAAAFAAKAHPSGDGRVTVRIAAGGLSDMTAHEATGSHRVTVSDNGPGIAPEDLPRIFDRFFTRGRQGGTGLGLALTQAIIEAHEGTIAAASTREGSDFTVTLPRWPPLPG